MVYPFVKYSDGTEVVFSSIYLDEDGNEALYVNFERPMEHGFDSIRFELPSYKITYTEGHYSEEEIAIFKTVVERGAPYFYEWAREGGIQIA